MTVKCTYCSAEIERKAIRAVNTCPKCTNNRKKEINKKFMVKYRAGHPDYMKEYRRLVKEEVFAAYGNKCACCGLSDIRFLTLDHKYNDGHEERKEISGSSLGGNTVIYNKARTEGFPERYQVLCWNCNCAKAANGGVCPHTVEVTT